MKKVKIKSVDKPMLHVHCEEFSKMNKKMWEWLDFVSCSYRMSDAMRKQVENLKRTSMQLEFGLYSLDGYTSNVI